MIEHHVNHTLWVSERDYPGDSVYRAWHCTECIRHNGSKGWTLQQTIKFGLEHQKAKHGKG